MGSSLQQNSGGELKLYLGCTGSMNLYTSSFLSVSIRSVSVSGNVDTPLDCTVADLQSKILNASPSPRSSLLHVHTVFRKIWSNNRSPSSPPPPPPPVGVFGFVPPPPVNHGYAPVVYTNNAIQAVNSLLVHSLLSSYHTRSI